MTIDNIITIVIGLIMAGLIAASLIVGLLYHAKIISTKDYDKVEDFIKEMRSDISNGSVGGLVDNGSRNSILSYLDKKATSLQNVTTQHLTKSELKIKKLNDKMLKLSSGK